MIQSRGGVQIWEDYRRNILADAENPILAWKAEKDKYSPSLFRPDVQERFPQGIPRIGSLHSEDALSWNLFRSLHHAGKLHLVTDFLSPGMEMSTLYLWGHSVDESSERIDVTVQEALNEIEPWGRDGRRQQTETDVMLRGPSDLVIIECKLGLPGKSVKAWIRSRPGMRHHKIITGHLNPQNISIHWRARRGSHLPRHQSCTGRSPSTALCYRM
jgi:hypothetical protein